MNTTVYSLPTTTRSGYTFNGWYTAASGSTKDTGTAKTTIRLTPGNTYYVRIRTHKTVDGKTCYSAWSSRLKVKITK